MARIRSDGFSIREIRGKNFFRKSTTLTHSNDEQPGFSKMSNNPPHVVMAADEENLQSLRVGAEEEADSQTRPALKYILP